MLIWCILSFGTKVGSFERHTLFSGPTCNHNLVTPRSMPRPQRTGTYSSTSPCHLGFSKLWPGTACETGRPQPPAARQIKGVSSSASADAPPSVCFFFFAPTRNPRLPLALSCNLRSGEFTLSQGACFLFFFSFRARLCVRLAFRAAMPSAQTTCHASSGTNVSN